MQTIPSSHLSERVRDLLASQWAAIGLSIDATPETRVVDPEALILATASVADRSPRLFEVSVDWCVEHGRYVNVARLRHLAKLSDSTANDALATYASRVRDSGGPAWPMAAGAKQDRSSRGRVRGIDFKATAALQLRLRALVGVNARAEILLRLAAAGQLGIAELAATSGYTKQSISGRVMFLADAGAVAVLREGNRDSVRLDRGGGIEWLRRAARGLIAPDWAIVLPMLVRLGLFVESSWSSSPRAVSTLVEARRIANNMDHALAREGWPRPALPTWPDFAPAFDRWVTELSDAIAGPRS